MKNMIFFAIGLIVGAGVGILSVKNHYETMANNEIEEVREAYQKKSVSKELADKNSEVKKELFDQNTKNRFHKEELNRYSELTNVYAENHNVFSNPIDDDEDEDESDDPYEYAVNHSGPSEGYLEPHLISEEEFASEKLFYDKAMIEYYADGVAILEETDEIVDSIEDLIGPDILGNVTLEDNTTIFVRNDNRSTDYGIIFYDRPFVREEAID